MSKDSKDQYTERPTLIQVRQFSQDQDYYNHKAYEDKLAILVCQIKIWQPKGNNWFDIPKAGNCLTIRECESIEVSDSTKDLIGKAVVKFPRGTVISLAGDMGKEVVTGNESDSTDNVKDLGNATNRGEVISSGTSSFKEDKVSVTPMAVNYDNKGLVDFNRTKTEKALLSPNNVAIGNRIEIRCGYAYSEDEYNEMTNTDSHKNLDIVFTGFITSVSVDTPLELECTNMGYVLDCINAPDIKADATLAVKDFLDDDGQFHVLKDTGIQLAEESKALSISVAGGTITNNITVANVLSAWSDAGVVSRMEIQSDGSVRLRVGRDYYVGNSGGSLPNNNKEYITYNGGNNYVTVIQFDWDVAQDKLEMKNSDKKYLAVKAIGRQKNGLLKLTVRKNPDMDDSGWSVDDGQFQVINERKPTEKKRHKRKGGTSIPLNKKLENHQKLDKYNVVTYMSITKDVTREQLIDEAKQYWERYSPNGITGSIEIFGDVYVKPTDIVGLIDIRHPEKNGYYYVQSVQTTFGVGGYRRELQLPFKMAPINNITIIQ